MSLAARAGASTETDVSQEVRDKCRILQQTLPLKKKRGRTGGPCNSSGIARTPGVRQPFGPKPSALRKRS
jgi:hypothetical protein